MFCEITAIALWLVLHPLNLVMSSSFFSNLDTSASACRCCEPLLEGAKSKNMISTGWSSFALKLSPLDKIAKKPFGFSSEPSVVWGMAIPFPTAVEPSFSLLIKLSNIVF